MTTQKKSWTEKLNESHGLPKVAKIKGKMTKRWGKGTVAIPAPRDVDAIMKKVPHGKLITINKIRKLVAKKHKATIGCPITCGIFAWIAAHAAEEQKAQGKKDITLWWRTLRGNGELNEKYPGGVALQARLLKKEGHKIIKKGKKTIIANFENYIIS
ncbi:MAG: hypothetical protein AB1465_02325 [Patescibacteria group bacterium]